MPRPSPAPRDLRAQRTRAALLSAFNELVLARPYESIRVADVIASARVGRSTFYEHFRDKDHLLRASLAAPISALATLLDARQDVAHAEAMLLHFAENRRRALALLRGTPHRHLVRALREQLEPRLAAHALRNGTRDGARSGGASQPRLMTLATTQLAGALLAVLEAWLGEELEGSAKEIARAMQSAALSLRGHATR
ncbi:MAG: TetR family transcriptional regulator [Planctomycetes bacterium]|nr:TetR family transcriptional regulator [Planctomycetota bacterium]